MYVGGVVTDAHCCCQNSPESLLRSALQGKGYSKGSGMQQLQNGITIIQSPNSIIKAADDDLRRAIFVNEQVCY